MAGQQPQTQVHQAPGGQASPGYGWAKGFYGSLPGLSQNPYPTYQGQLDPGLSPTLQNTIRMAQGYSQAGPSEILQGAQGSLGRFMTPSFMDPRMRLPMGSPNLFGANPNQKMYGGGLLGQLGQGFSGGMQSTTGGGLQGSTMNQGMPQMGGGRMPTPTQLPQNPWGASPIGGAQQSMGGGGSVAPQMAFRGGATGMQSMTGPGLQGGGGMQSMTGGGLQPGGPQMAFRGASPMSFAAGGGLQSSPPQIDAQSPQGSFAGAAPGGSMAWDMGNLKNRGMVQDGKIWMGGGQGGDSGSWQTYDPNNWGMKQTADMFSRYGSNWAAGAGSGGTGAHSSEMKPWLQAWLGRDPTQQEEYDLYYGVNPDAQKIKANFAAGSAAFDPSSASYDPNARYGSPAYRGKGRPGQVAGQPNLAALLTGMQKRG